MTKRIIDTGKATARRIDPETVAKGLGAEIIACDCALNYKAVVAQNVIAKARDPQKATVTYTEEDGTTVAVLSDGETPHGYLSVLKVECPKCGRKFETRIPVKEVRLPQNEEN